MDQKIIDLYDEFTHGYINRRDFLDRLTRLAGSTAAATAVLPLLQSDYALAAMVPANDPRLAIDKISYDSPKGKINGYLARPKAKGKRPTVLVIHQNRGLNPHIEDVTRRFAVEGFLAFAPDLLSVAGGTPSTDEEAAQMHAKTNKGDMLAAAAAAVPFLVKQPESTGKVGAVGFCYGGGVVNSLATMRPDLLAVVAYYGAQPPASKVPAIKAALLLHYAGLDKRIDAGIPAYEAALKANHKKYTIYMYENANHAFNDDTSRARYNKAAADLAWGRTLAFLKETLGAPPNAA
jgi:carboxymethylenebutenolidase